MHSNLALRPARKVQREVDVDMQEVRRREWRGSKRSDELKSRVHGELASRRLKPILPARRRWSSS